MKISDALIELLDEVENIIVRESEISTNKDTSKMNIQLSMKDYRRLMNIFEDYEELK